MYVNGMSPLYHIGIIILDTLNFCHKFMVVLGNFNIDPRVCRKKTSCSSSIVVVTTGQNVYVASVNTSLLKFIVTVFSISERQKTRAYVSPIYRKRESIEYNVNVQYTSSLQQFIRSIGVVQRGEYKRKLQRRCLYSGVRFPIL